jgi:hypothetical protein
MISRNIFRATNTAIRRVGSSKFPIARTIRSSTSMFNRFNDAQQPPQSLSNHSHPNSSHPNAHAQSTAPPELELPSNVQRDLKQQQQAAAAASSSPNSTSASLLPFTNLQFTSVNDYCYFLPFSRWYNQIN